MTSLRMPLLLGFSLSALLGACAGVPDQKADPLGGTSWQLIAIQSMDDAQGTKRIADPSLYTLTFGADGQASMRLDCNRGAGSWQGKPISADSGTLTFGTIAMTRAMCVRDSLDTRIARDLGFVTSYVLRDGNLFLALKMDSGIYEWAPLAKP